MDYKEVIESRYNRQNWQKLLHDIFGSRVKFWSTPSSVITSSPFAKQALWLGTITLSDERTISIYEVELADSVDIERNRRGIRDMLLTSWRNNGNAGAFMFCYRKNESVLRFSYVSESWKFAEDGSYQKETTDTRRFTYLLGEGHRIRTAIQQFQRLRDSELSLKDLTKAFSVEAVSDMFFDGYKKQYENIIFYITGKRMVKVANKWEERLEGKPCAYIMQQFAHFTNPEKSIRDYVKKLMGRIVFLQFLQKKGWLGVSVNEEWGSGDPEFIQNLFKNCKDSDHFVDNVLEPLFNDLNSERANDVSSCGKYKIPYLNGGLFEREATDETEFPLPEKYMQSLLDFFAQYNFTIDENDPDDAEVGVDPEMLGRIFENLLEDNKDKGAFYTPKEIVSYMCRESLIAYLQTGIEDEQTKEAIRLFVTTHQIQEGLPTNTDQLLKDVKICDPAIGSGAFPMGLLKELFLCRTALEGINQHHAAEIKKHIIQQNVYGVDIERGAVDIARLRFWLSLIVDEETPQALPNLDFKIMQGNSLIESYDGFDLSRIAGKTVGRPSTSTQLVLGLDSGLSRKNLQKLVREYFSLTDHKEKATMRRAINDEVKILIRESFGGTPAALAKLNALNPSANQEFFLWHTWFKDIFDNGGFDIVIGNPPYGAKVTNEEKECYKKCYWAANSYPKLKLKGSTDTFVVFVNLGHSLLEDGGELAFIVPMSIGSSDALTSLQYLIENDCDSIRISSYSNRPKQIFDEACVRTSIFMFSKSGTKNAHVFTTKLNRRTGEKTIQSIIDGLQFVDSRDLKIPGRYAKIGTLIEKQILKQMFSHKKSIQDYIDLSGKDVYYRAAGGRYFNVVTNYPTYSSAEKSIKCKYADLIGLFMSSSYFYFYQQVYTDGLNLKRSEIDNFPLPNFDSIDKGIVNNLTNLYNQYLEDIEKNAAIRQSSTTSTHNVSSFKEYKIVRSKDIIAKIDDCIGPLYKLSQEEISFIKNYEIEYRLAGE